MSNKRFKRFFIAPQLLFNGLKPGPSFRVVSGLPADAQLLRAGYDDERDMFYVTATSKEFEEVPDYQIIPLGEIILETVVPGAGVTEEGELKTEDKNGKARTVRK